LNSLRLLLWNSRGPPNGKGARGRLVPIRHSVTHYALDLSQSSNIVV
jgi:hypothetical protein